MRAGHGVDFGPSADDHGIPRDDTVWAMLHREVEIDMPGRDGHGDWTLYIGHPHAQTDRYIEVGAERIPPRGLYIFHSMELTDRFRYLLNINQGE